MRNARLVPESGPSHARIYRALRKICTKGRVFYVLVYTPEQGEDIFRILVDDEMIVGFELERGIPDAVPADVMTYSVTEYRKAIGRGNHRRKLEIALELARENLTQVGDAANRPEVQ